MKTNFTKRILAFLLILCMVIPMAPQITLPAKAAAQEQATSADPVIVVAGSDYQSNNAGSTVGKILTSIRAAGYRAVDGLLFAGDYSSNANSASATKGGLSALQSYISFVYPDLADSENAIYAQGDYDSADCVTSGVLSSGGEHDSDHYGVFVINEDDFRGSNESTLENVKPTVNKLKTYLNNKISRGYTKPIFVVTHVPLHYTMRTHSAGDSMYGNLLVDVLNDAGEAGLNLIVLYGHNHSDGWEDSHGGSAVFYRPGDAINVAQGSKTVCASTKINFVYMNAGYVGQYDTPNTGAHTTSNMSVFEITGDQVTISRYSVDGAHQLKAAGVPNTGYTNDTESNYFQPNYDVVQSPFTYKLNKRIETGSVVGGITYTANGILPEYKPILATTLEPGTDYVIKAYNQNWMLSGDATTFDAKNALVLEDVPIRDGDRWLYAAAPDGADAMTLSCGGASNKYITLSGGNCYLNTFPDSTRNKLSVYLNNDRESFTIVRKSNNSDHVHQPNNVNTPCVISYHLNGNAQTDGRSSWYFYTLKDVAVKVSVETPKTGVTIGQLVHMVPSVTVDGENTGDYTLTWSVENSDIASVDQNGLVKALKQGKTNIVATVVAANGVATAEEIRCKIPLNVSLASTDSPVSGVRVEAQGVTGVQAYYGASDYPDGFTCYYTYNITPVGYTEGTEATVSIPVEAGIDRDRPVFVIDHEKRKTLQAQIVDDLVTFTTDHFSMYSVVQMEETVVQSHRSGTLGRYLITTGNGEGMKPDIPYLITGKDLSATPDWMLTGQSITKNGVDTGLRVEPYIDVDTSHVWYVDADGYLRYLSPNGQYVQLGSSSSLNVSLSNSLDNTYSAHQYLYSANSPEVNFGRTNNTRAYLNLIGGGDLSTDNVARVYTGGTAWHSRWYAHKIVTGIQVTAQITASQTVMNLNGSIQLKADALLDSTNASIEEVKGTKLNVTDLEVAWSSRNTDVVTVDENGLVTPVSAGQTYVRGTLVTVNGSKVTPNTYAEILITVEDVTLSNNVITATTHYGYQAGETIKLDTTDLPVGGPYFVRSYYGPYLSGNHMTADDPGYIGSYKERPGLEVLIHFDPLNPPLWYLDEVGLKLGNDSEKYLINTGSDVKVGPNVAGNPVSTFAPTSYGDDNAWNIYALKSSASSSSYLYGASGFSEYNVATYTGTPGYWQLREVIPDRVVSFSVSPAEEKLYLGSSLRLNPKVTVDGRKISDYTIQWVAVDNSIASVDQDGIVSTVAQGKSYIVGCLTAIEGEELNAPLFVEAAVEVVSTELNSSLVTDSGLGNDYLLLDTDPRDGVPYVVLSVGYPNMVLTNRIETSPCDTTYSGFKLLPYSEVGAQYLWYFETDAATGHRYLRYGNLTDSSNYLGVVSNKQAGLVSKSGNAFVTWEPFDNGSRYRPKSYSNNRYLNLLGGKPYDVAVAASYSDAGSTWMFYTHNTGLAYTFSVEPENVELNLTETVTLTPKLVFDGATKKTSDYKVTYSSSDPTVAAVRSGKIVPLQDGQVTIKATLTQVTHDGTTHTVEDAVVYIPVTVRGIQTVTVNNPEGKLPVSASQSLKVSAMSTDLADPMLTITYTDGATSTTPLIGSYMTDRNGDPISTRNAAVYEDVTVTYQGFRATNDFTLHIIRREEPAYPVYPEPGSVQLNKGTNDTENFQVSGITQVELGVNGIPSKKGADVIVMLDTSSSMGYKVHNGDYRLYVLADSLNKLIGSFQQVQADGTLMDVRMAVADFNGNYNDENSPYYITEYDRLNGWGARINARSSNDVFTGNHTLSAGAFVNVLDMGENPFTARDYTIKENDVIVGYDRFADKYPTSAKYSLGAHSGTNYDYAFDAVYQLGQAVSDANALAGEERDLYVIFMSDGAPFQYNYFTGQSEDVNWNKYLTGTLTDDLFYSEATKEYYNPRGEHWMAEAIMGEPSVTYPVIRKNDYRDHDGDNFIDLAGLGATMYSIGFCLNVDEQITVDTMQTVIGKLASGEEYAYFPNSSSDLTDAFNKIFADIQYAATDAYVLDTIGNKFDLLLGEHQYTQNQEEVTFKDNRIEIRNYQIYTITDYQLGNCDVTQIGTRKTNPDGSYQYTVSETITFNANGTQAYSDQIKTDDGIKINILQDGVICAKNFWYNNNLFSVEIDFNGNGQIDDGEILDPETFYWKVGTITLTETVLNYYVQLTGALLGNVDAGIYPTNESASLHYENYLGESCGQIAPVPTVPWQNAQVGYGFYLVNKQGVPIINKESGQLGSFEQSIKSVVLTEVAYQEFNTGGTVTLMANRLLPREILNGYRIFDDEARYDVSLIADGSGSISVYTNGIVPLTTYVTGLAGNSLLTGDTAGSPMATNGFSNANTVVWFAVTVDDDAMIVDKTVEQVAGENKYTLTLESYSTGTDLALPGAKPADVVLVLDQSATMYTPVGIETDRISIDDLTTARQKLNGKQVAFNPDSTIIQENAKNLGYYIAIHNSSNEIYIVQYAQNQAGKWGWYYVPVDQTTRTVEVDTENVTNDPVQALNMGKGADGQYRSYGYGTYAQGSRDALPISQVTYYQSRYGAMYDTLQEFVRNLREEAACSGLDHRVAVVGCASPFYDGWTGYDGTGIYVDGNYYLYDSNYKYVKNGVTYDPDKVFSSTTENYSASTVLSDSKRHAYNVSDATYAEALVSLMDDYQSVLNSVSAYKANYQQTCPSIGITIAQSVFGARKSTANLFTAASGLADKRDPVAPEYQADGEYYPEDQDDEHLKSTYTRDNEEEREEIIILFSNGEPTVRCTAERDMESLKLNNGQDTHPVAHEFYSVHGGIDDVLDHAYEAKQAGIQIYAIASSKAVMDRSGTDFFKHVSSDDPTAQSKLTVHENWVKSNGQYSLKSVSTSVTISNSGYTDKGYTKYANGNLSNAFRAVYESIDSTVELGRDAVLKDVISDYFDLSAAASTAVKVYTATYQGIKNGKHTFSDTLVPYPDAIVEADNGVITVANFDYRGEYIGVYGGMARGKKLVVQLEIVPKTGFWGGNNIPTNKSDTAIYTSDGEPVVHFPVPQVNMSVKPVLVTQNQVVYYKEPELNSVVDLVESITVDGVPVAFDEAAHLTPMEPWMDDYATLTWASFPNVYNYAYASYGLQVLMKPKSGMTGVSNTTGKSNIAGTPIASGGIASDKSTAVVDVLVPLVTLQDSTTWIGQVKNEDYMNAANKVGDMEWINMRDPYLTQSRPTKVTMGTKPPMRIDYNANAIQGECFVQDTPVHVIVMLNSGLPNEENITNVSYFEWIQCPKDHQGIANTSTNAAYYRHQGNVASYEFYVHVKQLQPDAVVIDYGKPVSIDVLSNDDLPTAGSLLGVKEGAPDVLYSDQKSAAIADEATAAHGKMALKDGKVQYTPTDLEMNNEAIFTYAATFRDLNRTLYSTVTVIPATMIYYEDNAAGVTFHTQSTVENLAPWAYSGEAENPDQDQDRPGSVESALSALDADNIYGYDGSHKSSIDMSGGLARKVTVGRHTAVDADHNGICDNEDCQVSMTHDWVDEYGDRLCDMCGRDHHCEDKDGYCTKCNRVMQHTCVDVKKYTDYCDICGNAMTHTLNGRASFTFTGTGFDIISLCNAQTGVVMVNVYKGKVTNFDSPPWDDYVASYIVDTYFGYTYDATNQQWVIDRTSEKTLWQVPVIKADLTKVMTVMDDPNTQENEAQYKNWGYGTYSVEIYVAPSFVESEHAYWESSFYLDAIRIYNPGGAGDDFSDAELDAYKADAEAWPAYAEVRNMLIEAGDVDVENNDGLLYIDGGSINHIATYASWGPNNEVYLHPGQHIAFTMDMENYGQDVKNIHMAMRGLTGKGKVLVQAGTNANNKVVVQNIALSTTDLYYDIGKDKNGASVASKVITITNNGDTDIAITTIKVTHGTKPSVNSRLNGLFQSNLMTSYIALEMLNAKDLAEPTVTPKYPALSYNGLICYNVFFSAEDLGTLTADDLGLAVFDRYDPEGTVETARDVILGATQIDGLYMVATKGVNAKYLGDTQYFRAFAKKADGSFVYSKMVSYSALDYATNVLAKSNDVKLKQLVVAMLNYGAEAQKFFGYKTDDLMNKALTADHQALLTGFDASSLNGVQKVDSAKVGAFASTGGFTRRSPAISFNGAFEINYFFTPAHAVDGDMTLYFWSEDTCNRVTELTAENADKAVAMTLQDGSYTAASDEIAAKYLDKTLYVAAVYRSNGETYCSGVLPYSIAAYCQKPPAGVQALATAAAVYGCTAKQFFGV